MLAETELQASQARQDVAPSPGYGRLVIYLHNPVFGSIDVNRYNIAVDNIVIGSLTGTNALMIDLPAGAHHVQASNDISKQIGGKDNFERLNSVSPLVAAGMTSYVQITQVPLMPAPKLELADPSVGFSIVAVHARILADARGSGLLPAALSGPQPVAEFWPTPQNGIPPAPTVASVPPTPGGFARPPACSTGPAAGS